MHRRNPSGIGVFFRCGRLNFALLFSILNSDRAIFPTGVREEIWSQAEFAPRRDHAVSLGPHAPRRIFSHQTRPLTSQAHKMISTHCPNPTCYAPSTPPVYTHPCTPSRPPQNLTPPSPSITTRQINSLTAPCRAEKTFHLTSPHHLHNISFMSLHIRSLHVTITSIWHYRKSPHLSPHLLTSPMAYILVYNKRNKSRTLPPVTLIPPSPLLPIQQHSPHTDLPPSQAQHTNPLPLVLPFYPRK